MNWKCIISCLLLSLAFRLQGQEFYMTNISTDQGLPSSETYYTFQDSKGYIWITTDAGICRFDGKTITTYTTKDGISENVVFWAHEDAKGRVWFCTFSGYFFYYDYSDGAFHQIAANPELKKICGRYLIHSFFIGANDTVFCFTPSNFGLIKIPPQDNYGHVIVTSAPANAHRFLVQNERNKKEFIYGLNANNLCLDQRLQVYYKNNYFVAPQREKKIPVSINNPTFALMDKKENLYLFDYAVLNILNPKKEEIGLHKFSSILNTMTIDNDGDMWVAFGKEGGLFYKNGDLRSKPVPFLKGCYICYFMVDREGTMWINTLEKGVFRILNKNIFNIPIREDRVVDFDECNDELYVGLSSKNVLKTSDDHPELEVLERKGIPEQLLMRTFHITPEFSFYATTDGLYSAKDHKTFSIVGDTNAKSASIVCKQIIPLNGDSMLSLSSIGAVNLLEKNIVIKRWTMKLDLNVVARLKDGRVIAGTRNDNGLFIFRNGELFPFLPSFDQLKTRINCIEEDKKGNLWIATNEKGIFCYSNDKLYCFNQESGLETDKINAIDFDPEGMLWLGTARGLSSIDYSKGFGNVTVTNFDKSNGLPDLEIQKIRTYHATIWCASKENLFYFKNNALHPDTVPPQIYIKSVTVNNNPIRFADDPVLHYNENNFNISFDGLSFKNTETKKYVYQLQGYSPEWMSSNTGEIQFTNLLNGEYTFIVCALNNNNVKSAAPATFHFTILRPFWLTWWFITLMILFGIGMILAFIYWRTEKIRKREDQKTQFNKKIAEFHLTAVRAQMNPHFLFNAISSIQHYILSNDVYKSYEYLAKFSLLIRNVLDNSQEEYILISKEISTLQLYIELEQIRFKEPFSYTINVEGDLSIETTFIPTMLIQPYIENAIWHGLMPRQTDCSLELTFRKTDDKLFVVVKDNGVGRNRKPTSGTIVKQHKSKGISLTEQRLHALGVKTEQNFQVEIIDLADEAGNALGTEVRLLIPLISDQDEE